MNFFFPACLVSYGSTVVMAPDRPVGDMIQAVTFYWLLFLARKLASLSRGGGHYRHPIEASSVAPHPHTHTHTPTSTHLLVCVGVSRWSDWEQLVQRFRRAYNPVNHRNDRSDKTKSRMQQSPSADASFGGKLTSDAKS